MLPPAVKQQLLLRSTRTFVFALPIVIFFSSWSAFHTTCAFQSSRPLASSSIGFPYARRTPGRPPFPWAATKIRSTPASTGNADGTVDSPLTGKNVADIGTDDDEVLDVAGTAATDAAKESTDFNSDPNILKFRTTLYDLFQAAIVGIMVGISVGLFKLSIEALREIFYQQPILANHPFLLALIPAFGGVSVGVLLLLGSFPPGLRGTVKEVDQEAKGSVKDLASLVRVQLSSIRKAIAAVFTLGTGCSLGPEGPCVEIGMSVARAAMDIKPHRVSKRMTWNRLLLSSGAAAGVAAGFNAPIAGVFFALEIMQNAYVSVSEDSAEEDANIMLSASATVTPILLASVLSALIARTLLGNHLVLSLTEYSLKTPLIELPLYLLLGTISGCIAFFFSQLAKASQAFFDGDIGPDQLRASMRSIPAQAKPFIGGLLCGVVGLVFPQILFFGYETLNSLLANNSLPTSLLLSLLFVKMTMTAISAGSGLVGGTFAPSLFFGAMTGASFHNIVSDLLVEAMKLFGGVGFLTGLPVLELADVPAYAMVGAASVLAALFRAPLTASLLLFELTRDYDVILPLMASAGVGSIVGDILEGKVERLEERRRRDQDSVSWGDLADRNDNNAGDEEA